VTSILKFPTKLHQDIAQTTRDYFLTISSVDTASIVNSCARGQAAPESDLDIAILVNPDTTTNEIKNIETAWLIYSRNQPIFLKYKQSSPFAHIHLDIITGNYIPTVIEVGEPIDYFEIEIGNQICYSAPIDNVGPYFQKLQTKWLPYYDDEM
jgi:predicted nucleotidyltransferase